MASAESNDFANATRFHSSAAEVTLEMHASNRKTAKQGFTLVELLVVIAIVGILVGLLIPAVQAAREAARKTQCKNQLKQLTTAVLLHENAHQFFPTGGWDWSWAGDADLGYKSKQPGGWFYNILPYLEQKPLHDLGRGLSAPQKKDLQAKRIASIVPGINCPTRRPALQVLNNGPPENGQIVNATAYEYSTRIDYAICVGAVEDLECEIAENQVANKGNAPFRLCKTSRYNGISYQQSMVRAAQVTDGLSHTYCLGEKYLDAAEYESGIDPGDNETPFGGLNADHFRSTHESIEIIPDTAGRRNHHAFGAAHVGGFHMSFGDGSVRFSSFDIDPQVHQFLGIRDDGNATSSNNDM